MTNSAYAKNNGDGLPSAMPEGKNFNTHFWAAYDISVKRQHI